MTQIKNKILGFTESITTCDCCGKAELKGTYAIQNAETGDINYYGSVCAFKVYNLTTKVLKEGVKAAELEAIKAAKAEYIATPEYVEYTQHMIDREPLLELANRTNNDDEHFRITRISIELGNKAREVKARIAAKHGIKYTHKIG